jgi:oxygen-independent coproporphyrinogen III oxidase
MAELMISPPADLLARHDIAGPRYTSYPTADRFVEAFGPGDHERALSQRRHGSLARSQPMALYVHIPFCESVCYYCACNKVVTKKKERAAHYLTLLEREIELQARCLEPRPVVSQLHLGGGTPTYFDDGQLASLMQTLHRHVAWAPKAERSIEIDPRTADGARLAHLKALGFNRLSFGVQDFDRAVQQAVHRVQSTEQVLDLVAESRALGFESVNIDLIYGLPLQTVESFAATLDTLIQIAPDRVAVYAYAHLPERFKPQRRIDAAQLPSAATKLRLLSTALEKLLAFGYEYVGMDHFAKPGDALAQAKRQGRLHRNFQGYTTHAEGDVLGLGVSAISRIGACYSQNTKTLEDYEDRLGRHELPTVRGLALSHDDLVRRAVIMGLMCQGRVAFESVELAYLIDFEETFAAELQACEALAEDGLVEITSRDISVTELGWFFVREVAMQFDRHLQADRQRSRYSRVI